MRNLKTRLIACGAHFGLSIVVATLVAALVFVLWYPVPFREISGGRELFFIVIAVDVVLGPLITLAVFNLAKPRAELVRDLAVVVVLQLGGLVYGLHTVYIVRPVVMALEGDRLRVVRVMDLEGASLTDAPEEFRRLPLWGVLHIATRRPTESEKSSALKLGLEGRDLGMQPEFWLPERETPSAWARAAKPVATLIAQHPKQAEDIRMAVVSASRPADKIGFLPILARTTTWTALIGRDDGQVIGYVPVDGF